MMHYSPPGVIRAIQEYHYKKKLPIFSKKIPTQEFPASGRWKVDYGAF